MDELEAYRRSETELRIGAVYGCKVSAFVLERMAHVLAQLREQIDGDVRAVGIGVAKFYDGGSVERVAPAAFYTWPDKEG